MIKRLFILALLYVAPFYFGNQAMAQNCYKATGLNLIKTVPDPITNFDFSYLDLMQAGTGPQLFTLQILSGSVDNTCPKYRIRLIISTETNIINGVVYEGLTGEFTLSHTVILSSNQFFVDAGDTSPTLHKRVQALDDDFIKKKLLNSATVPTGKLVFTFQLEQVSPVPAVINETQMSIYIANIRYLRLVSPGVDVSRSGSYIPEVYTPYPQFLWQSDLLSVPYAEGSVKFTISVFENPDGVYPVTEITATKPIWSADFYDINFAQYPVSGVKPLIPGRRYFWQVIGILQGPVKSSIKSELYQFQIADIRMGSLSPVEQDILKYLEMILGGNYAYLMKDLHSMKPDESIILNNKKISIQELGDLARNFAQSKMILKKVTLK